jgi:hypothetical protein
VHNNNSSKTFLLLFCIAICQHLVLQSDMRSANQRREPIDHISQQIAEDHAKVFFLGLPETH